jgi:acetyl esterase/lipase
MPGRFTALAPICAYAERRFAPGQDPLRGRFIEHAALADRILDAAADLPVWLFHGERDPAIPAEESRRMAARLAERGADVRLALYPDLEHNSWDRAYAQEGLGAWLVSQRRD